MANEDSRENSVVGGAIKAAAIGLTIYGGYKGGRNLIKNYDDLGETFLGGVGKKMSSKIDDGIRAFDKSDGTNSIRKGLDNTQEKILQSDFHKSLAKEDSLYNKVGLELGDDYINETHATYNGSNRVDKREYLRDEKKMRKELNEDLSKSDFSNMKDYLTHDEEISTELYQTYKNGSLVNKDSRNLNLRGEEIKKKTTEEAIAKTSPL